MTLNITDAELHEWANMRADDAGRLARELVACRLQSQAAVAAAYEVAYTLGMEVGAWDEGHKVEGDYDTPLPDRLKLSALATPDQIAALAAERAATVVVNPLVWVKSHMTPWRDDWHTVPTAYTIRCCDENGWKWQGNGGHGYESSAKHAMTAVQGIHEAAIRSAITITSGTDSAKMHKAVEALRESVLAIQYLDERAPSGTTPPTLAKITAVLAEIGGA